MMQKVVVMGMGYVGFPAACAIAKSGKYEVRGYDVVPEKVNKINKKISPIDDKIAEKDIKIVDLKATLDDTVLDGADFVLVCVPTPIDKEHNPDLKFVISATEAIAKYLKKGMNIIVESTINPGVCDETVIPILEKTGLKVGVDFEVAHSPERINPGDPKWNVYNIPRNIGATTSAGTKRIADFYRSFVDAEVNEMKDVMHAEATKIMENSFRDINIAFVNELAKSFDRMGLDITEVIRGASNKPFAFMAHYPGCGVGGHCIPVDPYYLIEKAKKSGFDHKFLKIGRDINNGMPWYSVKKMMLELNKIGKCMKGTKVGLLGLSYKRDVADLRESPSFKILNLLEKLECDVEIYEPFDLKKSTVKSLDEVLEKSEVLFVATNHSEFVDNLSGDVLKKNGIKFVMDGRNCLDKDYIMDKGIAYTGIGR